MKIRLTVIAAALSALAMGPVLAGGAGGCTYGSHRYTSAEPQQTSEAADKLASLGAPASEQSASDETPGAPQPAEPATSR